MKKFFFLAGLLALVHAASAQLATNYNEFSLKFVPQLSTLPGPHSALKYSPSLTRIAFESAAGTVLLELTNNASVVDLSSIATPEFSLAVSLPLYNAMEAGTNAVKFGQLELKGVTRSLDPFSFTNVISSSVYKHEVGFDFSFFVHPDGNGDDAEIIPWQFLGNGFSEGAVSIWNESAKTGGSFLPIQWGDQAYPKRVYSGDVWPGFQEYQRTGRLNPMTQPLKGLPQLWEGDTNTMFYSGSTESTGKEGFVLTVLEATNHWEMIRLKVRVPLANGDTNAPH